MSLIRNLNKHMEGFDKYKSEVRSKTESNLPEASKWYIGYAESSTNNVKNLINTKINKHGSILSQLQITNMNNENQKVRHRESYRSIMGIDIDGLDTQNQKMGKYQQFNLDLLDFIDQDNLEQKSKLNETRNLTKHALQKRNVEKKKDKIPFSYHLHPSKTPLPAKKVQNQQESGSTRHLNDKGSRTNKRLFSEKLQQDTYDKMKNQQTRNPEQKRFEPNHDDDRMRKSMSFQELERVDKSSEFQSKTLNLFNDNKLTENASPHSLQEIQDKLNDFIMNKNKFFNEQSHYRQSDILFLIDHLKKTIDNQKISKGYMQKTSSNKNRSNNTDIKIKSLRKYEDLIDNKCKSELDNMSTDEQLEFFRGMNKEQIRLFQSNFAVLERMSEVPQNKLDLPKMVDQWSHSIKLSEDEGIDSTKLLDKFKDWYLKNWRWMEENEMYNSKVKGLQLKRLFKFMSPKLTV